MKEIRRRLGRCLALGVLGLAGASLARGQDTAGMGTTNGLPPGFATNPYANPAINPWLNPFARQGVMTGEQMSVTFLAARQQRQVAQKQREREEAAATAAAAMPAAEPKNPMMRPGGTASGSYFGRGRTAPAGANPVVRRGGGFFGRGRR